MKKRFFLLLAIMFIPMLMWAQHTSRLGRFQVDEIKGCAPLTVTILATNLVVPLECDVTSATPDPLNPKPCDMAWGDGVTQQDIITHTYTQPGTYTLSINYQTHGPDDIVITVLPNIQPSFNIYVCDNNMAQVELTDNSFASYIIDFNAQYEVEVPVGSSPVNFNFGSAGNKLIRVRGRYEDGADNCTPREKPVTINNLTAPALDLLTVSSAAEINLEFTANQNTAYRLEIAPDGGTFQNYEALYNLNEFTANRNLDTDNRYYCFRLGAVDRCSGAPPLFSNTICSARLTVTAQNNQNALSWITNSAGINRFEVQRDGIAIQTNATTPTTDTDVTCGTAYCYHIVSHYTNGSRSISHQRCVTAISTDIPPAITNISTVVHDQAVDLRWLSVPAVPVQSYAVLRQSNGGTFNVLTTTVAPTYTDNTYTLNGNFCYQINYTDACGNTSPNSQTTCPITVSYVNHNDNSIELAWNAYEGWSAGVQRYEIDKYDLQGNFMQTYSTGVTTFTDNDISDQGYHYVVRAIPVDGNNTISLSNEIMAVRSLRFAYPKAFTPDNHGPADNETFKVFVTEEFIASFEMNIFNRWGEMIFSTRDLAQGWDGKFNDKPQPEGTYIFKAVLVDKTGRTFKRDGSVVLLRKK